MTSNLMPMPKDKHDLEAIQALYNTDFQTVNANLPKLLTGLQDINWPIALPLVDYLRTNYQALTDIEETLLDILAGDDGVWKYWLIVSLGDLFSRPTLRQRLFIIAHHPTDNERLDEVNLVALEALEKYNL